MVRDYARTAGLLAGDFLAFTGLALASAAVRDGALLGATIGSWASAWLPEGYLGGWRFGVALVVGLTVAGAYGRGDARHHGARLYAGVAVASGLALWQQVWEVGAVIALPQFAFTVLLVGLVLSSARLAGAKLVSWMLPMRHRAERVLFIGHPSSRSAMDARSKLIGRAGMIPVGWVSDVEARNDTNYLGRAGEIWEVLQSHTIDTVVLSEPLSEEMFATVFEASASAGCRVLAPSKYERRPSVRPGFVWHHGIPFIELTVPSLRARQLMIKRLLDVVVSLLGLIVLSPFLAVAALILKLDSPGPVFFSHERVGLGGRVFRLLKFRTMNDGADAEKSEVAHLNLTGDPRLFKIPNDPRMTRFGRWLRRWSIDELPQLWNVLKGEMSLVGPRPFFEADLATYADHHFSRLAAKPGITGLWQVKGRSSVVDFEEVVSLDREYIDRWCLWLDFKVLGLTIPAVVRRTGAY